MNPRQTPPTGHPVHDPAQPADPDLREAQRAVAADVRRAAIHRLMVMNTKHLHNAWVQRRSDPLAPHGLAFLFVQPARQVRGITYYTVSAATKLWLADEDTDVAMRLFRYYHKVKDLLAGPDTDVRDLADRRDPAMAEDASYVGLGLSSLDTSTGAWHDVLARGRVVAYDTPASALGPRRSRVPLGAPVSGEFDIPGSIRIVLADGATIVAERRGIPEYDQRIIHSTHSLNFDRLRGPYPWQNCTADELAADPAHGEILRWMGALNDLLFQVDQRRLVRRQALASPRRPT